MDRVRRVIHLAQRRIVFLRSADVAGWIAGALLATFCVLVVSGVDVVAWRWLWLIAGLLIGFGAIRIWRGLPGEYAVAQDLDRRCDLQDTLATAWYVDHNRLETPAARFLLSYAGAAADRVAVTNAFPAENKRSLWFAAGMLGIAMVLLFARYQTVGRLDFHPSCLAIWIPPDRSAGDTAARRRGNESTAALTGSGQERGSGNAKDTGATASQSSPAPAASGRSENPLQRLRDALSNMLGESNANAAEESKRQPNATTAENSPGEKTPGGQNKAPGQNGKASQSAKSGDKTSGEKGEQAQSASAQKQQSGTDPGSAQKSDASSDSAQSGAGSNDGSKRIEDAAELKAMGKIEQLMGKQAQQVSGEMSIVKASGPQQLSTPLSGHEAVHGAMDSTVTNAPIAPEDREFVRKYMDSLHRVTDQQNK